MHASPTAQPVPERSLRPVLHHHIGALPRVCLLLTVAVERQNMQMVQAGDRASLLLKAFQSAVRRRGIGQINAIRANNLDRYLLANGLILRQVHGSHTATADKLFQYIAADSCAEQNIHCLLLPSLLLVAAVPGCGSDNGDDSNDKPTDEQEDDGHRNKDNGSSFASAQFVNRHDREDLQHNLVDADGNGNETAGNRDQSDERIQNAERYLVQQRGIALLEERSLSTECFSKAVDDTHANEEENRNDDDVGKGDAAEDCCKGSGTDAGTVDIAGIERRDQTACKGQECGDNCVENQLHPDNAPVCFANLSCKGLG